MRSVLQNSGSRQPDRWLIWTQIIHSQNPMKKFYQGRLYQELNIVCEGKDVKEKLLESFRDAEDFGYVAGYEPWKELICDRWKYLKTTFQ